MYLLDSAPMVLKICSMKYFGADEFHVTRLYRYSVLILMLDGVLRFYEDGKPVTLRKGEYYIQRAGLLQEGLNCRPPIPENRDAPAVYFYMEFKGGEFSEEKTGLPIRGEFQEQNIRPIISACEHAYTDVRKVNPFLLTSCFYRILGELYGTTPDDQQASKLLSNVKRYVESEYFTIHSVQDIGKKFGYNSDHLTKIFIQKYHISIYQYLKNVRMEHAMWLLQNMDLSLEQVARSVGYQNYSSFYRMFLSTYGISPEQASKAKSEREPKDSFK